MPASSTGVPSVSIKYKTKPAIQSYHTISVLYIDHRNSNSTVLAIAIGFFYSWHIIIDHRNSN